MLFHPFCVHRQLWLSILLTIENNCRQLAQTDVENNIVFCYCRSVRLIYMPIESAAYAKLKSYTKNATHVGCRYYRRWCVTQNSFILNSKLVQRKTRARLPISRCNWAGWMAPEHWRPHFLNDGTIKVNLSRYVPTRLTVGHVRQAYHLSVESNVVHTAVARPKLN